ncbi:hypothetical protein [Arenibaculum sp.]|jgi:hypothetical protein|uniref:hypothetical protein n=1 Tax=Arenibaculum sp. TaxID=2865862 RepID=UPI002E1650E8|nr:hypothetical protein [Arenibaculum sp.]
MDVTGFSPQSQLAMIGLRATRQQEQVMAQVVMNAAEGARQIAGSSLATPAKGASATGRLLDVTA